MKALLRSPARLDPERTLLVPTPAYVLPVKETDADGNPVLGAVSTHVRLPQRQESPWDVFARQDWRSTLIPNGKRTAQDFPSANFAPPEQEGEIGRLAHFRILQELGSGGMGTVFVAEDTQLQRPVALKVMRTEYAAVPAMRDRFLQEARLLAALRSDHIVTVFQVGEDLCIPFLAMELLDGMPLSDWLDEGRRLSLRQVVRIGQETALGLAAAHARGVIHRDIKPANLWLEAPRGRIKILDFGLARPMQRNAKLTQEGIIVGTPYYMSPEQAQSEPLDHRADLFSLGCVLYELCTGKVPFQGDTPLSVLNAIVGQTPIPLDFHNTTVPSDLTMLVNRLLAKNPDKRPPDAETVARAFEALKPQVE
jgi:serine/threonine protein kinase